jgi:hypothetical protein
LCAVFELYLAIGGLGSLAAGLLIRWLTANSRSAEPIASGTTRSLTPD